MEITISPCIAYFEIPPDMKLTNASIRGKVNCLIAAATERIVFDQKTLTRGETQRRGGVTVQIRKVGLESLPRHESDFEIGILVNYDNGGPAFESHRTWIYHNDAFIESKEGAPRNFTDFEVTRQSDGAIAVDFRWKSFAGLLDQQRFVL